MSDPILGQVALGYSPIIDRNRNVIATRLTVFPLRPDVTLDASQLIAAIAEVWPEQTQLCSLNVGSESLLHDLLEAKPPVNLMIEVPAFMACDSANTAAIVQLYGHGSAMLIKGRPSRDIPREALNCFKYSIIELSEDRRIHEGVIAPLGVNRTVSFFQAGVASVADMESCFQRGAAAVLGWPIDDAITTAASRSKSAGQTDLAIIVELLDKVDKEQPIERIEAVLKRDPSLAFKLMRYINSPAFGLSVEIGSFRHAIMMLGYKRLKRWLALLLATAGKDANLRPVMFAAVRRGLLMEELVRHSADEEMRNEMFICGVFSLLDRMFRQPFSELMKTIPVPHRVYEALVDGSGPYQPYFDLVKAVEAESMYDLTAAADTLMMSVLEINKAELRALSAATQLN